HLRAVDPGFDQEHVLIVSVATDGSSAERRDAFYARLLQEVRAVPGVVSAALANDEPLRVRTGWTVFVRPEPSGPPQPVDVSVLYVSPDYFKTMGMRMIRGREFDERDATGVDELRAAADSSGPSTPVVVNERFAKRTVPPGTDPVGVSF